MRRLCVIVSWVKTYLGRNGASGAWIELALQRRVIGVGLSIGSAYYPIEGLHVSAIALNIMPSKGNFSIFRSR